MNIEEAIRVALECMNDRAMYLEEDVPYNDDPGVTDEELSALTTAYGLLSPLATGTTYSLAEIRNGTGWHAGTRFKPVLLVERGQDRATVEAEQRADVERMNREAGR